MAWIAPVAGGLMGMMGQGKQNQQNQSNAQQATQQAQQFDQKMYNEMVANLKAAQAQAMGNYQAYMKANPSPVNTWGALNNPAVLGSNGMPVQGGQQMNGGGGNPANANTMPGGGSIASLVQTLLSGNGGQAGGAVPPSGPPAGAPPNPGRNPVGPGQVRL